MSLSSGHASVTTLSTHEYSEYSTTTSRPVCCCFFWGQRLKAGRCRAGEGRATLLGLGVRGLLGDQLRPADDLLPVQCAASGGARRAGPVAARGRRACSFGEGVSWGLPASRVGGLARSRAPTQLSGSHVRSAARETQCPSEMSSRRLLDPMFIR